MEYVFRIVEVRYWRPYRLAPPKNVLALPSASPLKKAGAATGQTACNTFHRSEYIASNLQFLIIVFVAAILV